MGESIVLNNGEQLRLCDANDRTIGIFFSPATLEQMNAERERLAKETDELRKLLDEAQRQVEFWKEKTRHNEKQVALLEQDWQSMFRLLPRELQVTEEDIREIQRDPHTFEELFREWEQK